MSEVAKTAVRDVDFVVLDLESGPWLNDCLRSIFAQSHPPARVLLFDNGSRVPASERVAPRAGLTMLRSDTNLGFAGGVNAALRSSSAAFVALVNSDVVLDRDWLASVLTTMDDDRVGAVQTIIRSSDGLIIDGAGIGLGGGTIRQLLHGAPLDAAAGVTNSDRAWGVSATAALYRRSAAGEPMFDPRFFAYYEDVELAARLHERGWQSVVIPAAKAAHRGSASASRLGGRARYLRTRNRYFVARLHPGVGRVAALLREDVTLMMRGRSSIRGIIAGLCSPLS